MSGAGSYLPSVRDIPLVKRVCDDLLPTPGRLSRSLRITLTTILLLILMLVLQMPFFAYGLYAIFVVAVESPSASLQTGIALIATGLLAVGIELGVVLLTDNDPMARLISVSVVTFLAGMVVVCTTKPNLGASWGLLFCLLIATWELPTAETILVSTSLRLLAALSLSVACTVFVEFALGSRAPGVHLKEQFEIRYRALTDLYQTCSDHSSSLAVRHEAASKVSRLAVAGSAQMLELYHAIVDRNLTDETVPPGTQLRIMLLARLMDESAAFGFEDEFAFDPEVEIRCARVAERCAELAAHSHCRTRDIPVLNGVKDATLLSRIEALVNLMKDGPKGGTTVNGHRLTVVPTTAVPLIIPSATRNPQNVWFALKISLCATICYVLYHAVDWPGISTSVTTVMVTGLTTTAAMKQRLSFRLVGAIAGGLLLGLGATVFVFPYMDSITALVLFVGLVAFGIAWISGGARFAPIALNIAFSFYFVGLPGARAQIELAPARDRLMGVVLAILVMWIVFDWVWPVRAVTEMHRVLASVLRNAAEVVALNVELPNADWIAQEGALRRQIGSGLATLRGLDESIEYDVGPEREYELEASDLIVQASLSVAALVWSQVLFLHDVAEEQSNERRVPSPLRSAIAANLLIMASEVGRETTSISDPPTALRGLPEVVERDEYELILRSRYHNVKELVDDLIEKRMLHWSVSSRPLRPPVSA